MIIGARDSRRVVVIHNYYQQRGGEDVVFETEMAMLRDRGWDVTPFTAHNHAVEGVSHLGVAARSVWNAEVHARLLGVLHDQRPAVMHVHNTLPILSPAVLYAARKSGVAVVQTLHNYRLTCVNGLLFRDGRPCTDCVGKLTQAAGVLHRCYRGSHKASAVVAISTGLHRAAGTWRKLVDRYIATTSFAAETFIAAGLPRERVVVKPHFLPAGEMPAATDERDGSGPALFIGRLSDEKGVGVLLAAMQHLPENREVVIVGDGPMRSSVMSALSHHRNLRWLGHLSRASLAEQLAGAGCVVVPSECYETFGRTIVEAFAHGVPVIASDHGALSSLVEHESTGLLFAPSNAIALAESIERLANHRDLNVRLGVSARGAFEQRFTENANYEMLQRIYGDALDEARARAA